ncbi:MAG: Uma2 family endonuclease [Solirubrobacterales bacterium]|nr:Uma2 family endonuclease [Solirubrobacterales bacterium]
MELIDGVIVEMDPMNPPHVRAVGWLTKHLVPQLDPAHMLTPVCTLYMPSQRSAPEPDIAVLVENEVGDEAPDPLLVIEVSDASLRYDRITKSRLYARRGVADYWILNVPDQVIEVHREPTDEFWGRRTIHHAGETLEPLRLPGVKLDIGALLAFVSG